MNQRLTKARLAEEVEADTMGVAVDIERMIIDKKASASF